MSLEPAIATILAELEDPMAPTAEVSVRAEEMEDADGEAILKDQCVCDPSGPAPEPATMFTATSLVCERLAQIGEGRFPVIRFLSRDDLHEAAD